MFENRVQISRLSGVDGLVCNAGDLELMMTMMIMLLMCVYNILHCLMAVNSIMH